MFNQKRIVVSILTKFMLLYFVLAIIPIDFYHHHQFAFLPKSSSLAFNSGHRTVGTVNISSSCLICNLHLDKQYNFTETATIIAIVAITVFGVFNTIYFRRLNLIRDLTSRGPPSMA